MNNIAELEACKHCGNNIYKVEKQTDADGEGETLYRICLDCGARFEINEDESKE